MAKKKEFVVIAQEPFVDALTGKSYRPGDVVTGWDLERAEHYGKQGQVRIDEPAAQQQPELPNLAGSKTGPKETAPKKGPEETKPQSPEDLKHA